MEGSAVESGRSDGRADQGDLGLAVSLGGVDEEATEQGMAWPGLRGGLDQCRSGAAEGCGGCGFGIQQSMVPLGHDRVDFGRRSAQVSVWICAVLSNRRAPLRPSSHEDDSQGCPGRARGISACWLPASGR
jgi:hypothetical protein